MKLYASDFDLDGEPATVIFSFDSSDNLDEVKVTADDWRTRRYSDRIFLALKTKYGEPNQDVHTKEPPNETRFHESSVTSWVNKNTLIIFSTMEFNRDGEVKVSITTGAVLCRP